MKFKVENICKKYKNNDVLKSFTYTFESGLYLLIGVNGAGKSTLLKIIAKVISPSNEDYIINEIKTAYLCEKCELSNENVLTFLNCVKKLNNSKTNIKELILKWNIPNKNIINLSKGNKQKVAILMMSLTDADVYLFDEPTDALDDSAKKLFCLLIGELLMKDKIVIISTHDKECFTPFMYTEIRLSCGD